jgi:hypothetical protein
MVFPIGNRRHTGEPTGMCVHPLIILAFSALLQTKLTVTIAQAVDHWKG